VSGPLLQPTRPQRDQNDPRRALMKSLIAGMVVLSCVWRAEAAEIVVTVTGVASAEGSLGCALFASSARESFPLDLSRATTQRAAAQANTMQCAFRNLAPGSYAVSAAHDVNGNGKTDRNFVGLPTEPWAVSNNVRPTLRAPRFSEAALDLAADETKQIELRLAR
jgi:uncharacterized protein (DUF2141 family)